jgi:hypothetical protein
MSRSRFCAISGACSFCILYGHPADYSKCTVISMMQDLDERILKVIGDYKERLSERTKHHMGYG